MNIFSGVPLPNMGGPPPGFPPPPVPNDPYDCKYYLPTFVLVCKSGVCVCVCVCLSLHS